MTNKDLDSMLSSKEIICPFCHRVFSLEIYPHGRWMRHDIIEGGPFGECDCGATYYEGMNDFPFEGLDDFKQQEYLSYYDNEETKSKEAEKPKLKKDDKNARKRKRI